MFLINGAATMAKLESWKMHCQRSWIKYCYLSVIILSGSQLFTSEIRVHFLRWVNILYCFVRKWKNEDAKIPVTPSFVLGTHQTVFNLSDECLARNSE